MPIISSSTSAFYERSRANMKDLRTEAENLQAQLGSGKKLSRSSDDPVAASRLRTLSRQKSLTEIDNTNANRANADLSLTDFAMSSMASSITRAQELATKASNSTLTDDQRKSIAVEMDQIFQDLVSLANSRDSSGHALFGGKRQAMPIPSMAAATRYMWARRLPAIFRSATGRPSAAP